MSSFSILIDTGCDLPQDIIDKHNIRVVPITFTIDDETYSEGYWQRISAKDFYNNLRNGALAKTAQVNPDTFFDVFEEFAKKGEDLIYVALSGALSGTCNSAQIAQNEIKEKYPDSNIYVVDSITASVGIGNLILLLLEKREKGMSAKDAALWLELKKRNFFGLFTVDDLMYLHRGGRLSKLSALAGSVIQVKPLLNIAPDGSLKLKDKARGRKAALSTLLQQLTRSVAEDGTIDTVFITHTDCEEDAVLFEQMIRDTLKPNKINMLIMGPIIGAHVGPGALGFTFDAAMTRDEYEQKFYGKG